MLVITKLLEKHYYSAGGASGDLNDDFPIVKGRLFLPLPESIANTGGSDSNSSSRGSTNFVLESFLFGVSVVL